MFELEEVARILTYTSTRTDIMAKELIITSGNLIRQSKLQYQKAIKLFTETLETNDKALALLQAQKAPGATAAQASGEQMGLFRQT